MRESATRYFVGGVGGAHIGVYVCVPVLRRGVGSVADIKINVCATRGQMEEPTTQKACRGYPLLGEFSSGFGSLGLPFMPWARRKKSPRHKDRAVATP